MKSWPNRSLILGWCVRASFLVFPLVSLGESPPVSFATDIEPIFRQHCYSCHGTAKPKGGFRLDRKDRALAGGDTGNAAIIPGDAKKSPLINRVRGDFPDGHMPPEGKKLSPAEIELLERWINAGADWSATASNIANDPRRSHWAWQPIQPQSPPKINPASGFRLANPIDAFIVDRLVKHGLTQSPRASKRVLFRRLGHDLLGLPLPVADFELFEHDPSPAADERLIDRLLANPAFGERWAQHWLDLAHYADTHGFERDQRRDHAYRYRDWVIASINADMPVDDFFRRQIAGDVLRPSDPQFVIATGFLAAGPWDFVGQAETPSPQIKRLARADDLDDMVTQVMTATTGITINCARCHEHKIDPISQRQYYELRAVFAGVKRADRAIASTELKSLEKAKADVDQSCEQLQEKIRLRMGPRLSLAGFISREGIDPSTGKPSKSKQEFRRDPKPNSLHLVAGAPADSPLVGTFLTTGGPAKIELPGGITIAGLPESSGDGWDAIRAGKIHQQFHATANGIDFTAPHRTSIGMHANAGLVFSIERFREKLRHPTLKFRAEVGCGSGPAGLGSLVSFHVFIDDKLVWQKLKFNKTQAFLVDVPIPPAAKFLSLIATDGGDGIGHDLLFLGDPQIALQTSQPNLESEIEALQAEQDRVRGQLSDHQRGLRQVFAIVSETPPVVKIEKRGNPEVTLATVEPGTIDLLPQLDARFGNNDLPEGERRRKLSAWITHPANVLTRRVAVNRIWQHYFGVGLVDTPSDFGLAGGRPSHPELLDFLADELLRQNWHSKAIHRMILTSETYRQSSARVDRATAVDANNRLLYRQNPRRLDAESIRDRVLASAGLLDRKFGGPGYRDFAYTEEYAPVYKYQSQITPEVSRRAVYRFVVRTTLHPFLTTLDCPNPANLNPTRHTTTTALQALALWNNEFILLAAKHWATRLQREGKTRSAQVSLAYQTAFSRDPSSDERERSLSFIESHGLAEFCRVLINSNEFCHVD